MTAVRVLHVDDEPDIREIVAISLGLDPEFEVRGCASGEAALVAAAEDTPDLILLDVMMPVMDGRMMLSHLRTNPRTAAIPVIFMTAQSRTSLIEEFRSLGVVGVIAKPFDPMTLASSVRIHLQPAEDTLAASRGPFLKRLCNDACVLFLCWSAFAEGTEPTVLPGIRDVAHGLAGASGIFGFSQIGDAAADLEEIAVMEINGAGAPRNVERALERLLTCIGGHFPAQFKRRFNQLDA
jgi:CheY-like chemotaxis protein